MTLVLFENGLFTFDQLLIENFNPIKAVAACYMVCNRKILVLKRSATAVAGRTWCMPGGKLEKNETPLQAVIREVKEETSIHIRSEEVHFMETLCIRIITSKQDYILHLFKATLPRSQPSDYAVILNGEHTDYLWVDLEAAQKLDLVAGGKEILHFLRHSLMLHDDIGMKN